MIKYAILEVAEGRSPCCGAIIIHGIYHSEELRNGESVELIEWDDWCEDCGKKHGFGFNKVNK